VNWLIGKTYRDMSLYGRRGKHGKGVRTVTVVAHVGPISICEARWVRGPLARFYRRPPRRVKILTRMLLAGKRYRDMDDMGVT